MPPPDEATPGPPSLPLPQATGRLPHGLRPIIPTGPLPAPAPPLRPPSLPVPPVHLPLRQPPPSMLATGLLPLEPAIESPPASPPVTRVEGKLSTGLLPISIHYPPSPTGTQKLVDDFSAPPPRETAPVSPTAEASRRPLPEEEKAAKLGLHTTAEASILPVVRPANQRRSSHTLKLFLLMLFIMMDCFIAFAALLYNYFQQNIEPRLGIYGQVAPAQPPPREAEKTNDEFKSALAAAHDQVAALQKQVEELSARQKLADAALKNLSGQPPQQGPAAPSTQLTLADGQISRLQAQVNELRTQQSQADAQLQKLAMPAPKPEDKNEQTAKELAAAVEHINRLQVQLDTAATQQAETTEALREMAEKSPPLDRPAESALPISSPAKPPGPPTNASISTVVAVNSEAGTELRLLKERNRLTLYADQALANASAEAMARLWQSIRDPDLAFVKDGAVAEIVRVQHFYGSLRGLPTSYRLPVADLFKDGSVHAEEDLKDEQVTTLLLDQAQPAEVRTRAAMFLTGHKTKAVGDALVEAMRHDPNLLVVKAAQNTLQDNFGLYEPRLFDALGMQKAWDGWVAIDESEK